LRPFVIDGDMTPPNARIDGDYVGILLAAGIGARFQAEAVGQWPQPPHKLLAELPDGQIVAGASAAGLLAVVPDSLAVITEHPPALDDLLADLGVQTVRIPASPRGMGISLAAAARCLMTRMEQGAPITGCVVALADMPWVRPETIRTLLDQADVDRIVVPVYRGRRGHPVVFGARFLPELADLAGDTGARSLLQRYGVREVECEDPGIMRDVDTPADLTPR
jgi:molybdenum cofactor cytidylyltransferase